VEPVSENENNFKFQANKESDCEHDFPISYEYLDKNFLIIIKENCYEAPQISFVSFIFLLPLLALTNVQEPMTIGFDLHWSN